MSILTKIQNFRTARKEAQEIQNAQETVTTPKRSWRPFLNVGAVLTAFCLMMEAAIPRAAAADLNLSWIGTMFASIVDGLVPIFPSLDTLIDAGFPLIVKIVIYGAILGLIVMIIVVGPKKIIEMIEKALNF